MGCSYYPCYHLTLIYVFRKENISKMCRVFGCFSCSFAGAIDKISIKLNVIYVHKYMMAKENNGKKRQGMGDKMLRKCLALYK